MTSRALRFAALSATGAVSVAGAAAPIARAATASKQKYTGTTENSQYGPVRVAIVVQGKKVTNVTYSATPDTSRSYQLETYALPVLRKEALKKQGYRINAVSGVTITSEAFQSSLYSALKHAKLV